VLAHGVPAAVAVHVFAVQDRQIGSLQLPPQQGCPLLPHAWQVLLKQVRLPPQFGLPPQHGWPRLPQAAQLPSDESQLRFAAHVVPPQQLWPRAPHGMQLLEPGSQLKPLGQSVFALQPHASVVGMHR
jgi:hypothetical protein